MQRLTDREYLLYSRTMLLNDIGEAGQLAILNSRVVIIGMGGLGQLVAQYLAASGVKHLILVDHDNVELSNLPRQLLYVSTDIGKNKASVAKRTLSRVHSDIHICAITEPFTDHSHPQLAQLITHNTVVFDCTDNIPSRHSINAFCVNKRLTLVSAAISAYQGQLFCLDFANQVDGVNHQGCYQCLYPLDTDLAQTCSQQGVFGPAVGVMASMQALFGLQHICRTFDNYGILLRFDALSVHWYRAKMSRDPLCNVCQQPHLKAQNDEF